MPTVIFPESSQPADRLRGGGEIKKNAPRLAGPRQALFSPLQDCEVTRKDLSPCILFRLCLLRNGIIKMGYDINVMPSAQQLPASGLPLAGMPPIYL